MFVPRRVPHPSDSPRPSGSRDRPGNRAAAGAPLTVRGPRDPAYLGALCGERARAREAARRLDADIRPILDAWAEGAVLGTDWSWGA